MIPNPFENLLDDQFRSAAQEIAANHRKIIDDWCKAYLAQLYEEGVDIKPGCFILNESMPSYHDPVNGMKRKYWFEKAEQKSNWIDVKINPPRKDVHIAILTDDSEEPQLVKWVESCWAYVDHSEEYHFKEYDILFWTPIAPVPDRKRPNHTCLPKNAKDRNEIVCQNTDYGLEILLPDRSRFSVEFCPFCGEKAEVKGWVRP